MTKGYGKFERNKMTNIETKLLTSLENKPEFLRANDLIDLGLFSSQSNICHANKRGVAPPRINIGILKKVYPKTLLVERLMERMENDNDNTRWYQRRILPEMFRKS